VNQLQTARERRLATLTQGTTNTGLCNVREFGAVCVLQEREREREEQMSSVESAT